MKLLFQHSHISIIAIFSCYPAARRRVLTVRALLLLALTQIYFDITAPTGLIILFQPYYKLRMLHPRADLAPHPRPLPPPASAHPSPHAAKNTYAGLTLKEYFNIADSKPQLDEIDEENNSQVSGGTPCFGGEKDKTERERPYRKNRNKTELQEVIAGNEQYHAQKSSQKMVTLSLEEFGNAKKNAIKLPSIHQQRQKNNSRQGLSKDTKDLKSFQKKETVKGRSEDSAGLNLALFLKKEEIGKGSLVARNIINARRGIRSRVTSTSFYHMNLREKERDRVKTEEEIEPALEKSFVITRYGGLMRGQNRDDLAGLKKFENSFKLTKN